LISFAFVKHARTLLCLLLLSSGALSAQKLVFLGLPEIEFGMHVDSLKDRVVVMDTTTSYKDTAAFIRSTRCVIWFKPGQQLQLNGFIASRIEYEFCDKRLHYVFVRIRGKEEIAKAVATLKTEFTKADCWPIECQALDTSSKKFRLIASLEKGGEELSLVVIPKKLKY